MTKEKVEKKSRQYGDELESKRRNGGNVRKEENTGNGYKKEVGKRT